MMCIQNELTVNAAMDIIPKVYRVLKGEVRF